jgi:hypothetical protein
MAWSTSRPPLVPHGFLVLHLQGLGRRLMPDTFAVSTIALRQFAGARREFLGQRGLLRQRPVTLCPQRRDDGTRSAVLSSGGPVIRSPSRQPSPP